MEDHGRDLNLFGGTTQRLTTPAGRWDDTENSDFVFKGRVENTRITKPIEPLQETRPPLTEFEKELSRLINRYSMENLSGTPDYILAEYLNACLAASTHLIRAREQWYGRKVF